MAIEKYLQNPEIVFDPSPSYLGLWFFKNDNLIRNSKKQNEVNLFQDYYLKTIYNPLKEYFKRLDNLKFSIGFISSANDNLYGRHLNANKMDFFLCLTRFLNSHIDRYGLNNEEFNNYLNSLTKHITDDSEVLNNIYSEALSKKEKKLKTLVDNEFTSEYFEAAMQDYEDYKLFSTNHISFTSFIKNTYELTKDLKNGLKTLGDFFEQDIDYQKLYECFDPDTFYLLFATIIYEFNIMSEKETNELDNSWTYLHDYFEAVKKLSKEDKRYNPSILYIWNNGKKEKISRWELQIRYEELFKRHPEIKSFELPTLDNPDDYKDIALIEKLKSIYSGEAKLNWEFLPAGEKIKQKDNKIKQDNNEEKDKKNNKEDIIEEINMRIQILENSGYIGTPIKGLNTFSGYYAFIYPNGKVILEKFWNNEDNLTPAVYNATYVMNIDNFIEMSKIPKVDLIEYMKTLPEIGVKRIFHTSINNWQRNLYQEINGSYRLEDAIDFISSLKTEDLENEQ